jgi:hypothetical protein
MLWKFPWPLLAALALAPGGVAADTGRKSPPTNLTLEARPMVSTASGGSPAWWGASAPLRTARSNLVQFKYAPFPYYGSIPGQAQPFFDVVQGRRRGHTSQRGGIYWEKPTYSDRSVLLYLPPGFDIKRPALIVAYFHGNETRLLRDVRDRQQVLRQLAESGLNAALVAPQFAVDARDSSAGRFWSPDMFAHFLDEAAGHLGKLHGSKKAKKAFSEAPVVIVAYSGGYHPAAFAATIGGLHERLRGMLLMDAPYGDEDLFADWILAHQTNSFFLSTYATASRSSNDLLKQLLVQRGVGIQSALPDHLLPGTVAFFDAGDDSVHEDFMTQAWTNDPLKSLLARIPGFPKSVKLTQAKSD